MTTVRALATSLFLVATGCGGDPAIVSAVANPTTVAPGGTITMTVELDHFTLGPDEAEASLTARGLRTNDGGSGGHIHTYLDNTDSNPLAQTTLLSFPVVISSSTARGAHALIVRLHDGDHLILEPEVKTSVAITVQ